MNQLRILFGEFGIACTEVKVLWKEKFVRKTSVITFPAYFRIMNRYENRKKFFERIAFFREERKLSQLKKSIS